MNPSIPKGNVWGDADITLKVLENTEINTNFCQINLVLIILRHVKDTSAGVIIIF